VALPPTTHSIPAISCLDHLMVVTHQGVAEEMAEIRIVIDNKNARHGVIHAQSAAGYGCQLVSSHDFSIGEVLETLSRGQLYLPTRSYTRVQPVPFNR
jgi:hypothetical protein